MKTHHKQSRGEPDGLAVRLAAAQTLDGVLKGGRFSPIDANRLGDARDRALANRLVTLALRRHGQLSMMLSELLERGMPKKSGPFEAMLRLSLAQLVFAPDMGEHSALFLAVEAAKRDSRMQHLSKLMNAVLRKAQGDAERYRAIDLRRNLPEWLATRWQRAYGAEAVSAFAAALQDSPALDLTLKDMDPALVAELGAEPVLADTVRIVSRDKPVDGLPGYDEGRWWVQDVASALPARLVGLEPGALVLDLCAAPGGKTAQLVKAGYTVTALDSDAGRMERLKANLDRLCYQAETVVADARTYTEGGGYDAVLLDAPCSATGTFRRHPEVLTHVEAAGIAGRVALQRELILAALNRLNPGGVLLYATCSLEPEEGEAQARWLASTIEGVAQIPILADEVPGFAEAVTAEGFVRTHPGMVVPGTAGGTLDGFFVARFRKG